MTDSQQDRSRGMNRSITLSLFAFALALGALAIPSYAEACSCVGPPADKDERNAYYAERIADSDAAIVAKVLRIRRDEGKPSFADDEDIYTLRIRRTFKGLESKRKVKIHTARDGATCGLELGVGAKSGLLLYREKNKWHGNLCGQAAPKSLRRGAKLLEESGGKFTGAKTGDGGCEKSAGARRA